MSKGRWMLLWSFFLKHVAQIITFSVKFSSVAQSCLTLCGPCTAARQASLTINNSWSLLKLMSIKSVIPSNHLIFSCPLLLLHSILPSIRVFFQWVSSSYQVVKVLSFSFSISPSSEYSGLIPLGWTGWISYSPTDSQASSPTPQFKSINSSVFSFLYTPTLTSIHDYWKNHSLN